MEALKLHFMIKNIVLLRIINNNMHIIKVYGR